MAALVHGFMKFLGH